MAQRNADQFGGKRSKVEVPQFAPPPGWNASADNPYAMVPPGYLPAQPQPTPAGPSTKGGGFNMQVSSPGYQWSPPAGQPDMSRWRPAANIGPGVMRPQPPLANNETKLSPGLVLMRPGSQPRAEIPQPKFRTFGPVARGGEPVSQQQLDAMRNLPPVQMPEWRPGSGSFNAAEWGRSVMPSAGAQQAPNRWTSLGQGDSPALSASGTGFGVGQRFGSDGMTPIGMPVSLGPSNMGNMGNYPFAPRPEPFSASYGQLGGGTGTSPNFNVRDALIGLINDATMAQQMGAIGGAGGPPSYDFQSMLSDAQRMAANGYSNPLMGLLYSGRGVQ